MSLRMCQVPHLSYNLTEHPGQGHIPGYSVEQMCIDHWCEPCITLCSENEKQKKAVPDLRKWSPLREESGEITNWNPC